MTSQSSLDQSILRFPPGKVTTVFELQRPNLWAATWIAQAPVPQAKVGPAPLSHTFTLIFSLFMIWQKWTLVFSGNYSFFSNIGPSPERKIESISFIKNIKWGFPIPTA